ncbi:MAG: hypothetical protein V4667_13680 [Bacteroidota bacterium]
MKKLFIILTIFTIISCSEKEPSTEPVKNVVDNTIKRKFSRNYPSQRQKWTKHLDSTLVYYMDSIIATDKHDYIINLYTTCSNVVPCVNELISLRFNLKDSLLISNVWTSSLIINDTTFMPFTAQNINWHNKFYNPVDTILKDLQMSDWLFGQPPEIEVDGGDGYIIILEVKTEYSEKYILRWAPNWDKMDKFYPKRKELVKLINDIKRFSIGNYPLH